MAGRGGKRSTSFAKGEGGKPKGRKNRSTLVKESMGLTGWEKLCSYILNEGAEKYVDEMQKLKGRDFHVAYNALTEFVKPKLTRAEVNLKAQVNLSDKPIVFE